MHELVLSLNEVRLRKLHALRDGIVRARERGDTTLVWRYEQDIRGMGSVAVPRAAPMPRDDGDSDDDDDGSGDA